MSVLTISRRARSAARPDMAKASLAPPQAALPDGAVAATLQGLASYVPGDVIAVFMLVTGLAGEARVFGQGAALLGLWVGLALCVVIVGADYLARRLNGQGTDAAASIWAGFSSVTGFAVWALAMPESDLNAAFGGLPEPACAAAAMIWSIVLSRLAPVFEPEG